MRKEGQIGDLIIIIPVMFSIFIVMGLFVVLSAGFSLSKGGESGSVFASKVFSSDDLMFQSITIEGQRMNVIDAVQVYLTKEVAGGDYNFKMSLKDSLGLLMDENYNCLFLFKDYFEHPATRLYGDFSIERHQSGDIFDKAGDTAGFDITANYEKLGLIRSLSFLVNNPEGGRTKIYVDYYYGECLA